MSLATSIPESHPYIVRLFSPLIKHYPMGNEQMPYVLEDFDDDLLSLHQCEEELINLYTFPALTPKLMGYGEEEIIRHVGRVINRVYDLRHKLNQRIFLCGRVRLSHLLHISLEHLAPCYLRDIYENPMVNTCESDLRTINEAFLAARETIVNITTQYNTRTAARNRRRMRRIVKAYDKVQGKDTLRHHEIAVALKGGSDTLQQSFTYIMHSRRELDALRAQGRIRAWFCVIDYHTTTGVFLHYITLCGDDDVFTDYHTLFDSVLPSLDRYYPSIHRPCQSRQNFIDMIDGLFYKHQLLSPAGNRRILFQSY